MCTQIRVSPAQADELLPRLFDMGSELLLEKLPAVFAGEHKQTGEGCIIQNDEDATHAAKMSKEEGELWFTENCKYMHNRVRAFAGWPGTSAQFVINRGEPDEEKLKVKIITTRVAREEGGAVLGVHQLKMNAKGDALVVTCDDGSQLEVLELQLPSKKPMDARAFWNGVRGRKIERARVPWSPGKVCHRLAQTSRYMIYGDARKSPHCPLPLAALLLKKITGFKRYAGTWSGCLSRSAADDVRQIHHPSEQEIFPLQV